MRRLANKQSFFDLTRTEQALQVIEGLVCLLQVLTVSDTFERSDDPFVPYPDGASVLESRHPDVCLFHADDGVGSGEG